MTAPTPEIPTFLDGIPATQQDLQDLAGNLQDLYALTLGGFRTRPPQCQARMTSAQTVASGTDVLLSFGAQDYDTDGMFAPTSSIITIVTGGLYRVGFHAHLAPVTASAGAVQLCRMTRNSTSPSTGTIAGGSSILESNYGSCASCSIQIRLTAGDVLRCYVRQSSGNSTSILLTHGGARAYAHWIAP